MTKDLSSVKVAIVHDWLIGGGAEKVVLAIHEMFPQAPIYTSYSTMEWRTKLDHKVITGYLGRWPFSKLRKYIPYLRARWFSHLDLSAYDLVISSSGAEAKGVKASPSTIHINYCHAPTHYYWSRYDEYLVSPGFGIFNPLARVCLKLLVGPMRRWDLKAAQRPNYIIANSTHTQSQIKKYYNRGSTVIHPPVDVQKFQRPTSNVQRPTRSGLVIAGRQTPYKKFDLAVAACTKLSLPLKVIGNGPEHDKLKKIAGPTVTFIDTVTNDELPAHFQSAEAFIFPGLDDFGITPVEAMAAGTPVIAFRAGGAFDYVEEGKTGIFFDEQSVDSLGSALEKAKAINWDEKIVVNKAVQFSPEAFKVSLRELINQKIN